MLKTGATVDDFDIFVVCEAVNPLAIGAAADLIRRFMLRHPILRTTVSQSGNELISLSSLDLVRFEESNDGSASSIRRKWG